MQIRHMCLDVRGVLLNWTRPMQKRMAPLFIINGRQLTTADELRAFLADCLAEGKEVIPLTNEACEGFDYKTGCPGHERPDDAGTM